MESSDIPLWPAKHSNGPRRMCFLSGEARWYLWLQEGNKQAITSLRRDLLLLHQNGDLQLFRTNIPSGTYIAALHDGRMIRGRICPTQNTTDCLRYVTAIDVDDGIKLNLPLSQVRALPPEMKLLPCQAVRVDIGLDCIEQFDWPEQLNNMLMKAIGKALIFVDIKSKRPGSIPTIDADVTIVNPSTGQSISIQKWLIDCFSQHLDLCGLERFKPFPVGMSADLMVNNMPMFQQPVFGLGMPGSPSVPSGLPSILPSSGIPSGMPLGMPPSFPLPMPPPQAGPPLIMTHGMPYGMPPRLPMSLPPTGGRMPPLMSQCPQPSPNIFPTPTPPGSTISATLMSFSVTQPARPVRSAPPPPHNSMPFKDSIQRQTSSNNSSTGLSASSSLIFESDSSFTCDSDCPPHSESSVGIDLNESFTSSSSLSGPNPYALPFFPKDQTPSEMTQSGKVVKLEGCPKNHNSPRRGASGATKGEERIVGGMSSCLSAETAPRGAVKLDQRHEHEGSSSGLSAEAAPFVPKVLIKNTDTATKPDPEPNLNCSAGRKDKSAQEPHASPAKTLKPAIASRHSKSPSLNDGQTPSPLLPLNSDEIRKPGPLQQFPKGKEVQLKQILRDWKIGQVVPAFMARVWNPSCFEVNVIDDFSGLLSKLQTEMDAYYKCGKNKMNMSSKQQARDLCGDFCACYDADEDLWFRAQVNEWFMDDSVTPLKVWAVDYGGYSQVDLGSVQPLSTELACTAPVLVTLCSMKNVISRLDYDIWPEVHLNRVKELMPEDNQLFLRIDGPKSQDDIWPVSVFKDPDCSLQSINEILVAEGCAYYVGMAKESSDVSLTSIYEDAENPMAEAYELGANNYDIDDEDACVAVSGRKPTEETGICWFFQRNGYCYKKFCDLRHERLDPDGHSIAKEQIHHDSFEKLTDNVLSPGSQVKLTITRILTVNHFIATISTKGTKLRSRETLKSVIENLNTTHMKRQLKTFTEFPADGEIVLYKDTTNGTFYRGRIICADMVADEYYKVLNVDTGYKFKIPLKDLRKVDPAFLHHPFQAMECWLADVAPTQSDREWTKSCNAVFADLVQNQKLLATVVRSAPWGIEVNLINKDGQDLAAILKEMNIVKSCPRRHLPLDLSHRFPG
ncbi:uncharacterized protein LOC117651257 isoform X2 [Thrips palmi]|nr:uncharacterized protein LOC117651257 isoform X2 [Thrips palmi]